MRRLLLCVPLADDAAMDATLKRMPLIQFHKPHVPHVKRLPVQLEVLADDAQVGVLLRGHEQVDDGLARG